MFYISDLGDEEGIFIQYHINPMYTNTCVHTFLRTITLSIFSTNCLNTSVMIGYIHVEVLMAIQWLHDIPLYYTSFFIPSNDVLKQWKR